MEPAQFADHSKVLRQIQDRINACAARLAAYGFKLKEEKVTETKKVSAEGLTAGNKVSFVDATYEVTAKASEGYGTYGFLLSRYQRDNTRDSKPLDIELKGVRHDFEFDVVVDPEEFRVRSAIEPSLYYIDFNTMNNWDHTGLDAVTVYAVDEDADVYVSFTVDKADLKAVVEKL